MKLSRTSAEVEYPVLVFFPLPILSFSNNISPSCLAEFTLRFSSPARFFMSFSSEERISAYFSPVLYSSDSSTLNPAFSISNKTSVKGSSMSR